MLHVNLLIIVEAPIVCLTVDDICISRQLNAPVKWFCPYPPLPSGHPRGHHFFRAAPVSLSLYFCLAPPYIYTLITLFSSAPPLFITLFLPCPALINHFNPLILECPALFSLHFSVPCPFLSHKIFL